MNLFYIKDEYELGNSSNFFFQFKYFINRFKFLSRKELETHLEMVISPQFSTVRGDARNLETEAHIFRIDDFLI